jgi:chlorophyllide a reductase subunit Y
MKSEIKYDDSDKVAINDDVNVEQKNVSPNLQSNSEEGLCGSSSLKIDASKSANRDLIEQMRKDYPLGPHDKPQSMCPAFGSLRVGLRMKRVATVLSGSACCVYGLTFVSHFYGARRSVGYVPFSSETLVTGKLYEDILASAHEMADPERFDAVVFTNLCVPSASGVPLRLLPKQINGVRIIGIDVPGFGIPTHAEAKDVLAGALLNYAKEEIKAGPVAAPNKGKSDKPTLTLLGEMFPADPMNIGELLGPLGIDAGQVIPCREWRELYSALDCGAVAAIHPFYSAAIREFEDVGKPIIGSAPVGVDGTATWLDSVAKVFNISHKKLDEAKSKFLPRIKEALEGKQIKNRITVSGYEGSELIVARTLIEAGAEVPYVGSACPKTKWAESDIEWLEKKGTYVKFRASLEDDISAVKSSKPDLAIGTTPVVQKAKELGIPSLYFTNLISARPIMGVAGASSLAEVIENAIGNKGRMAAMKDFFEGVGVGDTAGVWEGKPNLQPHYRAHQAKKIEKRKTAAKAEEMI